MSMELQKDGSNHMYAEVENIRITYIPASDRATDKDWANSDVIRIQSYKSANDRSLNMGAELPIRSTKVFSKFIAAIRRVYFEGREKDETEIIQEIPDAQVKDAADQFEEARKLLKKQQPGTGMLLPEINCAAMAIELYLKSLAAERVYSEADEDGIAEITAKPLLHGHNLVKLFEKIDVDIRNKIEKLFSEQNPKIGISFLEKLRECEGVLEASRYPFDKNVRKISEVNNSVLHGCSELLSFYVKSLMKEKNMDITRK